MRLALLGLDETTLPLVERIIASGQDDITFACDAVGDQLRFALPSLALAPEPWEALLAGNETELPWDAVVVSRDDDEEHRLEQLRRLVQAGVPLLISHPIHHSMLAYYELDMIRRETACVMAPLLPARLHPFATLLQNLAKPSNQSTLGQVDQLVFERSLDDRTRETVLGRFARDVDLLRFIAGEVHQLGAMGSPGVASSGEFMAYNNLSVQMAGQHGRIVRWSIHPAHEFSGARLTVSGSAGRATLLMPDGAAPWRLEIKTQSESRVSEGPDWNPYTASLEELRAAISDRHPSRWPDAARAVELAETIDRSLAKGRTINLHEQEFSETSTFKGMMTSVGCALLLAALVVVVAAIVIESFLRHAGAAQAARLVGAVPYVIVGLLAVFLAMQLLLKLAGPGEDMTRRQDKPKGDA